MLVKYITHSPFETKTLGEKLARFCLSLKRPFSQALVIVLEGHLGGGKTTFLQGMAKVFHLAKALSPSFVLCREYSLKNLPFQKFYHFDFYRLQKASQIEGLGWREKLADAKNIIAVEWGEKFPSILPKEKITVKFKLSKLKEREIQIKIPPSFLKQNAQ